MYCPWQARWITGVTTSGFVLPQLKQPTNEVKHAQVNMLNLSCSLVRSLFPLHCIFKRVICLRLQLQSRTRRSTSFGGIHKLQTSSNFSYKIWIILDIICIYIYISPIEWKLQVVSDMQSTGVHEILPYDWHAPEIPLNILNEPKLVPSEPILRHIKTTDLTKANKERPPATMQTHTRTHTSLSSAHAYQQTLISINCGSLGDHLVQPCWLNQWKRTVPVGDLK